jgi:UDP-3-O-[3-hydroxymyristoyl] glucosamine N-acyltransferase
MKLVIVGAGDLGRVVAEAVLAAGRGQLAGFVDDRGGAVAPPQAPLLGRLDDLAALKSAGRVDAAVVAVASALPRRALAQRIEALGLMLATIVHPSAVISPSARLAEGVIVAAGVVVGPAASLHKCAIVNTAAVIEHDAVLEPFCYVGPRCLIDAYATVAAEAATPAGAVIPKRGHYP